MLQEPIKAGNAPGAENFNDLGGNLSKLRDAIGNLNKINKELDALGPQEPAKKPQEPAPSPYIQPKVGYNRSAEEADRASRRFLANIGLGQRLAPGEELADTLNSIMRNPPQAKVPSQISGEVVKSLLADRAPITTLGQLGTALFTGKYPTKSNELVDSLNKIFSDASKRKNDNLTSAVEAVRTQEQHNLDIQQQQELHSANMTKIMQDVYGTKLKNEKTELDTELAKTEAAAKGLYVPPQDPPTQKQQKANEIATAMSGVKWPSDGVLLKSMLTQDKQNPTKGFLDAYNAKLTQLKIDGEKDPGINNKLDSYIQEHLLTALQQLEDTSLDYSPFGGFGKAVGGALDILLPGTPGTSLLGGTIDPISRVRVLASVSPLVRAEIQDTFNRDKLEQTAAQKLARWGKSGLTNHLTSNADEQGAELIANSTIEIDRSLQSDVATSWGPNATTGLRQAFNQFENVHKFLAELMSAKTEDQATSAYQQVVLADQDIRDIVKQYLENGGTIEQFGGEIRKTIESINTRHQKPLERGIGIDAYSMRSRVLENATAFDWTNKLADLYNMVTGDIPLNLDPALKKKLSDITDKKEAGVRRLQETLKKGRFH